MDNHENSALPAGDMLYSEDVIEMFDGKISKNILYAWVREKKIPALKAGHRFIFSRKRVQHFIDKHLGLYK